MCSRAFMISDTTEADPEAEAAQEPCDVTVTISIPI